MTVLICDVKQTLLKNEILLTDQLLVHELLYADDTLLMDVNCDNLQAFIDAVVAEGKGYGLEINWKKVEIMSIRCEVIIKNSSGRLLDCKSSIQYLGALINASGNIDSELCRRLGMAKADFKILKVVWNYTSFSAFEKYNIF